jgi:hypothetical protein
MSAIGIDPPISLEAEVKELLLGAPSTEAQTEHRVRLDGGWFQNCSSAP